MIAMIMLVGHVQAAGQNVQYFSAPVNMNNQESLQNGAKWFMNYCLGCHSIEFQRYNVTARDIGLNNELMQDNLMFTGSYSTREGAFIPSKIGDQIHTAMNRRDAKFWFGAAPPDLSTIVRAKGADYVYTYLRSFYLDASRPVGVNNLVFPSVGMPHVLVDLQGVQEPIIETTLPEGCAQADDEKCKPHSAIIGLKLTQPGTLSEQEYNRMVGDLVNFLAYVAEPAQLKRAAYGPYVLIFLLIFIGFAYALNREYWKGIH